MSDEATRGCPPSMQHEHIERIVKVETNLKALGRSVDGVRDELVRTRNELEEVKDDLISSHNRLADNISAYVERLIPLGNAVAQLNNGVSVKIASELARRRWWVVPVISVVGLILTYVNIASDQNLWPFGG